jgi:hypothetical protein
MTVLNVPVTKGKATVSIDTETIPVEVYAEALALGLKELVNRGASKITAAAYPDEAARKAKAMEVADEQVKLINTGKIKFAGAKVAKASGAVMTEARRLAKNIIKDEMKRQDIKISHVAASEITKAANLMLNGEQGKAIVAQAEANLKERETVKVQGLDIKALIKVDPALVAKAEARKAKDKADKPLSATQAGKPKARAKGQQATA